MAKAVAEAPDTPAEAILPAAKLRTFAELVALADEDLAVVRAETLARVMRASVRRGRETNRSGFSELRARHRPERFVEMAIGRHLASTLALAPVSQPDLQALVEEARQKAADQLEINPNDWFKPEEVDAVEAVYLPPDEETPYDEFDDGKSGDGCGGADTREDEDEEARCAKAPGNAVRPSGKVARDGHDPVAIRRATLLAAAAGRVFDLMATARRANGPQGAATKLTEGVAEMFPGSAEERAALAAAVAEACLSAKAECGEGSLKHGRNLPLVAEPPAVLAWGPWKSYRRSRSGRAPWTSGTSRPSPQWPP